MHPFEMLDFYSSWILPKDVRGARERGDQPSWAELFILTLGEEKQLNSKDIYHNN